MKTKCNCNCNSKLFEMDIKLQRLQRQVKRLSQKNHNNKIQKMMKHDDSIINQTYLLDQTNRQESKIQTNSIQLLNQKLNFFNQKISQLDMKIGIIPSLKEKLNKQTTIIYYLQQKIESFASKITNNQEQTCIKNKYNQNQQDLFDKYIPNVVYNPEQCYRQYNYKKQ